jgi:radical SAM superfamily enzyme YgiQ (UPF0313 family)
MPHLLDGYPFPDRKKIDLKKYVSVSDRHPMTTMNSSRGCPFRCVFCNVPRYYMTRSATYIVDEIEEILALGFREIHILDDTFNSSRQRVFDICSLIRKRGLRFRWSTRARLSPFDDEMACAMREAGCFRLNVGVESHDPSILAYIDKHVTREAIVKGFQIMRRYKFETLAYFILGCPGQTEQNARETLDFVREVKPTFILLNTLAPTAFSNFYFELIEKGIYKEDHWLDFVLNPVRDFALPSWRGREKDEAFNEIRDEIMRRFYLSPSFVAKELFSDIIHGDYGKLFRKFQAAQEMIQDKALARRA